MGKKNGILIWIKDCNYLEAHGTNLNEALKELQLRREKKPLISFLEGGMR
jgi:hypothetical protein